MVAITPDSPIGAVFGSHHKKRKLAEEGLGLRTVGDLLRHFPRRYIAATELSEVPTPVVGEQLTIVGEVRSCESASFFSGNRRQFRTTVRLRTDKTKGCLSRQTALAMVFKLAKSAERRWRRLDGTERLAQVIAGVRFRDGEPVQNTEEQAAA